MKGYLFLLAVWICYSFYRSVFIMDIEFLVFLKTLFGFGADGFSWGTIFIVYGIPLIPRVIFGMLFSGKTSQDTSSDQDDYDEEDYYEPEPQKPKKAESKGMKYKSVKCQNCGKKKIQAYFKCPRCGLIVCNGCIGGVFGSKCPSCNQKIRREDQI